jgi:hypothetical protein
LKKGHFGEIPNYLDKAKLLLALDIGFLFLAMDRGRATLDAADRPCVELALADLFNDATPLYFARESIQKRLSRLPLLFSCFYCHERQYKGEMTVLQDATMKGGLSRLVIRIIRRESPPFMVTTHYKIIIPPLLSLNIY